MENKEKQRDVGTMKRGRTGHTRVARNEEQPDVIAGDPTWNHGRVLACAATGGHIWGHDPAVAGFCYHQKPGMGCHQRIYCCLRTVHNGPHPSPGHAGTTDPRGMRAGELTFPFCC